MKTRTKTRTVLAALAIGIASTVAWTPTPSSLLIVSVGEVGTGAFIKDAEVRLVQLKRSVRTHWDGEARFRDIDPGRIHVQVRAIGFAPGDIDVLVTGDSLEVHFELERTATALDTVRVSEAAKVPMYLNEFETRRSQNVGGKFLTDSVLQYEKLNSLQTVLATRFPGIKVFGGGIMSMEPSGIMGQMDCPVLLYLDGHNFNQAGRSLQEIRPDELIGIEYYSRTFAPVQYKPVGNYCKVILMWTRR
jgi:hypothetical protein